jgi:PKD repeat protein
MVRRIIAIALAVLGLGGGAAAPATAHTLVVDQAAGPYTTIGAALMDAGDGDTIDIHVGRYDEELLVDGDAITLHGAPGAIVSSTAPYVVSLRGDRDRLDGLTVAGTAGGVLVTGANADIADATITAADRALAFDGAASASVARTLVRATADQGNAVYSRNDAPALAPGTAQQYAQFQTAIVVGGRLGTAFDVRTGRAGDVGQRGSTVIALGTTTVATAPTALASGSDGTGGPVTVAAFNSIVHGSAPGLLGYRTEQTAADAATFVNHSALDFHLRADAPAVAFSGGLPYDAGAARYAVAFPTTDFGGAPRRGLTTTSSVGAYEFLNHAPTAQFSTSATMIHAGQSITFDAGASSDPDAAVGGRVASYRWAFGDLYQSVATPVTTHTYPHAGHYTAWLITVDNNGEQMQSGRVEIFVLDVTPPKLTIRVPKDKVKMKAYRTVRIKVKAKGHQRARPVTRRTINVLRVNGTGGDGATQVQVELRRVRPTTRAPRGAATAITRVVGIDPRTHAWSYHSSAYKSLAPGAWVLTARAKDPAGNTASSVLHFTVT